jgi:hypothetical protein
MPIGTQPCLLMMGVGNPIAVHGHAREGARRGEPTVAIHVINSCRKDIN